MNAADLVAVALATCGELWIEADSITDVRPVADLRATLSPKQLELVECEAKLIAVHAGRRAGKTTGLIVRNIEDAQRTAAVVPYLCLTAKSARIIAWPILADYVRRFELGTCNDSTMTAKLWNGGQLICGGTDDIATIQTYRGTALGGVTIDECGAQRSSLLKTLHQDILKPALGDHRGRLAFAGTPAPTMSGYFDDLIKPDRPYPVFHWDVRANPFFRDPEGWLAEVLVESGWTEANPTYRREYLGLRVRDDGSLVMPYTPELNGAAALPILNEKGFHLAPHLWRFFVGSDLGHVSALAITIVATHPHDRHDYFVWAEKHRGWIADQWGQRLRNAVPGFEIPIAGRPPIRVGPHYANIADLGGLGVEHAERIARAYGVRAEPAEKRDRESALRWARDRLVGGSSKVLDWPQCDELREEWAVLPWNDARTDVAEGFEDHAHDAGIYALRRARNWALDKPKGPTPGTEEWFRAEAERIERLAEQRASQRGGPKKWYR